MTTTDDPKNSAVPAGQTQIPSDIIDESTNNSPFSPDEVSEQMVSGSMPDPESDDDMLDNAHDVGLYTETDDDDAQPLNIADQIEKAEKYHRDH